MGTDPEIGPLMAKMALPFILRLHYRFYVTGVAQARSMVFNSPVTTAMGRVQVTRVPRGATGDHLRCPPNSSARARIVNMPKCSLTEWDCHPLPLSSMCTASRWPSSTITRISIERLFHNTIGGQSCSRWQRTINQLVPVTHSGINPKFEIQDRMITSNHVFECRSESKPDAIGDLIV